MSALRSGRRLALVGVAFMLLIACSIAVWRSSKQPTKVAFEESAPFAVEGDAGVRRAPPSPSVPALPDAGNPEEPPKASPTFPVYAAPAEDLEPVETPIDNADRLDYYFGKLTRTDLGLPGAITRAGQWGDSVIGGDGLTEAIRRKLQERFGDAGHGFHIMGKYNRWYHHRGMRYAEVRDWETCLIIFKCQPQDMRYGYGGVVSTSRGKAFSRFQTMPKDPPPGIGDK